MLGKPEWFTYRLLGWGLRPVTWQGNVYVLGMVGAACASFLAPLPAPVRPWFAGLVTALVVADFLHVMSRLDAHHDERERLHQLIIERNCSFAAVAGLTAMLVARGAQLALRARSGMPDLEGLYWPAGVLILMGLTKLVSTFYLRRRM